MSPLVAYHATRNACRESIMENGLLPNRSKGRHVYGVYVFRFDDSFDHPTRDSHGSWNCEPRQDLWQVEYIGPILPDRYIWNALILLGTVDHVTLVTGN